MREVNGTELESLVKSGKTVVCDFWAAWCGPCRMLAPVMEKLSEEFDGCAQFVKLNVDSDTETAIRFGVMSIPDVFVFEGGEVKAHNLGYVPEQMMRDFLNENLRSE